MWDDLEIKDSVQGKHAGKGVFAKNRLEEGMKIMIYGIPISEEVKDYYTHVGMGHYITLTKYGYLDSNPKWLGSHVLDPNNRQHALVALHGSAITGIVNEPKKTGKPNMKLREYFYEVVANSIPAGTELTVCYGTATDYKRPYETSCPESENWI